MLKPTDFHLEKKVKTKPEMQAHYLSPPRSKEWIAMADARREKKIGIIFSFCSGERNTGYLLRPSANLTFFLIFAIKSD